MASDKLTTFQIKAHEHMAHSSTSTKTHFAIITRTGARHPWYEKEGIRQQY